MFERIAVLRTSWANVNSVKEKLQVESKMSDSLKAVMAVVEDFPELKANENFILLQSELSDLESKIAMSRQIYNDVVTMYNTKLEVVPSNIFANLFGFKEASLFLIQSKEAKDSVKVQF